MEKPWKSDILVHHFKDSQYHLLQPLLRWPSLPLYFADVAWQSLISGGTTGHLVSCSSFLWPLLEPTHREGNGTPLQYSCLENWSLVGCSPWGHEESDTAERLHFYFSLSCTGEENGNPLQCSCLENPRDGGAWWAAVYGVTQSQTRLKWLSSRTYSKFKHTQPECGNS